MPRVVNSVKDSYGFPLGIAYVSACIKKAGFNVSTLNLNQIEGSVEQVLSDRMLSDSIDVVMTGGLSAEYCMVRTIIEVAKRVNDSIITVVGGGIISSDPETAMEALEYVDFGVIGEGEITSVELCNALETNGDFSQINGLIYKAKSSHAGKALPLELKSTDDIIFRSADAAEEIDKGKYIKTVSRVVINDLDTIPWPDYEGFDMEDYLAATLGAAGFNGGNTLAMISARSCPFGCTFCFHTIGRKYRARSHEDFFKELEYYISRYNIKSLSLNDDLFGIKESRLIEFCNTMIEKNYGIHWMGAFRLTQVNPNMLKLLKEANCFMMGFGLESADNRILKSMEKKLTIEQAEKSLAMVAKSGISISACLIMGDPEETRETAQVSFDWWKRNPQYYIPIRLITPYPGTPIYEYACRTGKIKDKVQYLRDCAPQVNISKMSDEDFQDFTLEVMKASFKDVKNLASFKYSRLDAGCVNITGECSECGSKNEWERVRLFKLNFVACIKCGQQYFPPLDGDARDAIDKNILKIQKETSGKIGLWGMTVHTVDAISNSEVLKGENIYPIDICQSKQHKNFFGKQVFSPHVIDRENIETVIVSAPNHIGFIQSQIETNYKHVTRIIDISNLNDPDFDLKTVYVYDAKVRHNLNLDMNNMTFSSSVVLP